MWAALANLVFVLNDLCDGLQWETRKKEKGERKVSPADQEEKKEKQHSTAQHSNAKVVVLRSCARLLLQHQPTLCRPFGAYDGGVSTRFVLA